MKMTDDEIEILSKKIAYKVFDMLHNNTEISVKYKKCHLYDTGQPYTCHARDCAHDRTCGGCEYYY